jgi:uncharacterized protein (TIGR03437 family)
LRTTIASRCPVADRLSGEAVRLIAALLALTAALPAQPTPASISTINQPTSGAAVFDASGNVYYLNGPVTPGAAQTQSGGFCPTEVPPLGLISVPCSNDQIVKVDPAGSVIYGTYVGGPTATYVAAIVVDPAGNVFVTGPTGGSLPTASGAAIPASTTSKTFAARLSTDGSTFLYSTYLPDSAATATAIAIDSQDNAYITGKSVNGAPYVVKLSPDGSSILYNISLVSTGSTTGSGTGSAITIDPSGNAIVAGSTSAPSFPVTPKALQSSLAGTQNIFLAKLDPASNVTFATYLGGSGTDTPSAVQTDSAGNIYVAGATSSLDFPTTPGTLQPTPIVPLWNDSSPAGFAAKINSSGNTLEWSTYVMSIDSGLQNGDGEMAVTPSGDVYLGGISGAGFPVTPSAPEPCFANGTAGFIAHLNSQGALADATYLNDQNAQLGADVNFVWGLAVNAGRTIDVVWHYAGNNVASTIQFGSNGWTAPGCLSTTLLNAATMYGNVFTGVAPVELITLTGLGIGPDTAVAYQPGPQGQIPNQLAGVQVFFDGSPVPVLYAQSRQINALAPAGIANQAVTSVAVTYNNQLFGPVSVPVVVASPGIFRLQVGASGQALAMNQDNTTNSPSNPAATGSIVTVWATGFGPTDPACTPGGLNVPEATGLAPGVIAKVLQEGTAVYAGSAPGLPCGVVQLNFQVPDVPAGTLYLSPEATGAAAVYLGSTIAVK